MKLALARVLVLTAAAAVLAGCSGSASTLEEPTGSSESAIVPILPYPGVPVLSLDPMSLCDGIVPDAVEPYYGGQVITSGTANAARSCDYYVVQFTGTYGQPIEIGLTDFDPNHPGATSFPVTDAASCAKSFASYQSFGLTPPHIVGRERISGRWESIHSEIDTGVWVSTPGGGGRCSFAPLEDDPTGWLDSHIVESELSSIYETVSVASSLTLYTPAGVVTAPLWTLGLEDLEEIENH
jgi:hypothetical protein